MSAWRSHETRYERKREWQWRERGAPPPLHPLSVGHGRWRAGALQVRNPCPAFGVEIVLAGSLTFYGDGRRLRLGPGEVLLKQRGAAFRLRTGDEGHCRKIHATFAGGALPILLDCWHLGAGGVVRFPDAAAAKDVVRPLVRALTAEAPATALGPACYAVLEGLARGERRRRRPAALAAARDFIRRRLDRELRVDAIAAAAGIAPARLHRLFREHLGTSPIDYALRLRLERARELLRDDRDLLIKQVARRCGFADQRYFARAFKADCGATPQEWRRADARL